MNDSIRDILTTMGVEDVDQVLRSNSDIKIIKSHIRTYFSKEDGNAFVNFDFDKDYYKTNLRGTHQAVNCAHCIAIAKRLGIVREVIDNALVNVPFNGHFETLNKQPSIIFDVVENNTDMKNFTDCVYDYFGRKVQRSLCTPENLHPEPFKKLVIANAFYPELASIKQNVTIIFTDEALRDQYLETYNGIVKVFVMPFEKALKNALTNYSDYKIFIIGSKQLYSSSIDFIKNLR